jgi:hypothetical protein
MKCHIIDFDAVNWRVLDGFADRTVFQTREWIQFIHDTQKAVPVMAELHEGGEVAGYFTGLTFRRFGIKILGSSFPGWTTPYIGFNLVHGASRASALAAVEEMAWGSLKCLHMEISDPHFTIEDGSSLGFTCGSFSSYRTDLRKPEQALFDSMTAACRRCIRKAEKCGVKIAEAHDLAFADEYHQQLVEVFARQKLIPTYTVDRVRTLIKHLEPEGRVLLLRAHDAEGKCIATGVYPGFNKTAEFWGNASTRSSQIFRPNELMHWYAMRYWKRRGVEMYDWGGEGKYKEKYGCVPYRVPWFTKSRHELLSKLRHEAKKMFEKKQQLLGWLHSERTAS